MARYNRDVGGYRGRRTITDILRITAVVLAVLVVLMVAGMLYLQRYVVYTDKGARLDLPPFLQFLRWEREEPDASLPAGTEDGSAGDVGTGNVSTGDMSTGDVSAPPDASQEPAPQTPEKPGYALALPVSDVLDGTAAAKLEQAGADALVLEMKDQEGRLAWHSQEEIAQRAGVNGPDGAAEALRTWNQGDVYTIARVCCFRDNSAPYYYNRLALRGGGGNWRDPLGLRWLSPAQPDAQAYLANLCGELAAMGFDEIVLEQFSFPVQGHVERIIKGDSYDPAQFTAVLENFLGQVGRAAVPYGTKISLRVERDTLAGTESLSGVTGALLEQYAARVWAAEDGLLPELSALLEGAGVTGGTQRLVAVVPARQEGNAVTQAVLPER